MLAFEQYCQIVWDYSVYESFLVCVIAKKKKTNNNNNNNNLCTNYTIVWKQNLL